MAVATAVAVGGLAISAATTANSFIQAGKQKDKQREAEASAAAAMAEARKKLSINYTDELSIKKEPYELQREAMLSQGAQAIQAGVESERGAAATAGKVMMAQNEAQAGVRTAMGAEMTDIQKQQIAEQSRLRDLNVQLDLGEVEGAQNAARSAEEAATAQTQQGIQGIGSMAQQGLNMLPLYFKDSSGMGIASVTGTGVGPGANPQFQSPISEQYLSPINTSSPAKATFQNVTAPMPPTFAGNNISYTPAVPNFDPGTRYGMFGVDYSGLGYGN